jgi:NAD-dependent dihydropyrimidine dehydrogenase PreA subunit
MDTPDKLARYGTQEKLKQTHNTDSTKKQGWSQVLTKGQQFMFLIWHLPCYSCMQSNPVNLFAVIEDLPCYSFIQSSPVKVLPVITDRKHLHKMWKIHFHLRYGYFLAVNQIVMTTVEFVSDHFSLGVIEDPPCYSCIQSSPVKELAVIEVPSCYSCIQSSPVKVLAVIE